MGRCCLRRCRVALRAEHFWWGCCLWWRCRREDAITPGLLELQHRYSFVGRRSAGQVQRCDVFVPRLLFASVSSCSLQCGAVCCYSRCTMQAMQRLIRSMSAVADAGLHQFALIWRGALALLPIALQQPHCLGDLSAERPPRGRSRHCAGPIGALDVCKGTAEFVRVSRSLR